MMKRFLLTLLFLSFSFNAFAESSFYEIEGVTIKTSASNSLSAKQKALSSSLHRAFNKLLKSYFPDVLPLKTEISESDMQNCVYDYAIDQEKFSGKIYIAKFSFRFTKTSVTKVLRKHNIKVSDEIQLNLSCITLYTQDYLRSYNLLKNYKVILFSPRRIVLQLSSKELQHLIKSRILFEKVYAEIYS